MIQTMGGFVQRNNQGWGDGGEEGQSAAAAAGSGRAAQQANGNGARRGRAAVATGGREERREQNGEAEPGLGGVAFLQSGRSAPTDHDPAADEQPEVPEFTPATGRARLNRAPLIFE